MIAVKERVIDIPVTDKSFAKVYLMTLNGLFGMTPKEIDVLSSMIGINKKYTATKEIRVQLAQELGIPNVKSLNNIIKALKDKKVITKNPDISRYEYNPLVIPNSKTLTINFKS